LDSISRDAGSRSWYQYQPLLENEESVETGSQKLMTRRGLSRDRPLAAQIMHVIGNGGWEKRVIYFKAMPYQTGTFFNFASE